MLTNQLRHPSLLQSSGRSWSSWWLWGSWRSWRVGRRLRLRHGFHEPEEVCRARGLRRRLLLRRLWLRASRGAGVRRPLCLCRREMRIGVHDPVEFRKLVFVGSRVLSGLALLHLLEFSQPRQGGIRFVLRRALPKLPSILLSWHTRLRLSWLLLFQGLANVQEAVFIHTHRGPGHVGLLADRARARRARFSRQLPARELPAQGEVPELAGRAGLLLFQAAESPVYHGQGIARGAQGKILRGELAEDLIGMHQLPRKAGQRAEGHHDGVRHLLRQLRQHPAQLPVLAGALLQRLGVAPGLRQLGIEAAQGRRKDLPPHLHRLLGTCHGHEPGNL